MLPRAISLVLSFLALVLVFGGLALIIISPFLHSIFSDLPPPSWTAIVAMAVCGFAGIAIGIWFWILAWKRWLPRESSRS